MKMKMEVCPVCKCDIVERYHEGVLKMFEIDYEMDWKEGGGNVFESTGQEEIKIIINGEEFIYYKGKVYKGEHEVLGAKL